MPVALSAEAKQLRWKLLEMFPDAPMKLVSSAAQCQELDVAVAMITSQGFQPVSSQPALSEQPAEASVQKTKPADAQIAAPACEVACNTTHAAAIEAQEALSWLTHATAKHVTRPLMDVNQVLGNDKQPDDIREDPPISQRTADGWEIKCNIDTRKMCQSMRTEGFDFCQTVLQHVGTDNTAAYAAACFEQMIRREQELEGEFCVFYHSYNTASLIYEVEAEIARYAFGKDDKFAPLPRILQKPFAGVTIDDLRNSEGAKHQDCLPEFRALAICASPTLFAFGSEAPPLDCFRGGYGIHAPLGELTRKLLSEATGLPDSYLKACMKNLADLGHKFGLATHMYSNESPEHTNPRPNRLGGQMLQIFIHRSEVDDFVYNSLPYGVPIPTDSVERWLAGRDKEHKVDGQVRILMRPELFLDEHRGCIYHYCGDWEFLGGSPDMEGSRAAFVQELHKILQPILSKVSPAEMRQRLTGETDAVRLLRLKKEAAARKHNLQSKQGSDGYLANKNGCKTSKKKR